MREIKASEFKAKCLKLMDEINETGEAIAITKEGKTVARLVPTNRKPSVIGQRNFEILGPIVGPHFDVWGEEDPLKGREPETDLW